MAAEMSDERLLAMIHELSEDADALAWAWYAAEFPSPDEAAKYALYQSKLNEAAAHILEAKRRGLSLPVGCATAPAYCRALERAPVRALGTS
jgi:hypothetical protein